MDPRSRNTSATDAYSSASTGVSISCSDRDQESNLCYCGGSNHGLIPMVKPKRIHVLHKGSTALVRLWQQLTKGRESPISWTVNTLVIIGRVGGDTSGYGGFRSPAPQNTGSRPPDGCARRRSAHQKAILDSMRWYTSNL